MPESSMFKIIGGNGIEYGPVTADEVRQWIADGRANGQTLARAEGTAEWKPIASFPEFAGNVTAPPRTFSSTTGDDSTRTRATRDLTGPFIGLIATVVLGLLGALIVWRMVTLVRSGYDMSTVPGMTPDLLARIKTEAETFSWPMFFVRLAGTVFVFVGALRLRSLKNYGLCIAACIVAMVPYLNHCCIVGLPIGIWGLVILFKAEVRACFK